MSKKVNCIHKLSGDDKISSSQLEKCGDHTILLITSGMEV